MVIEFMAQKSPIPHIEILDKRFLSCVGKDIDLKRIWTGGIWTEGPAWLERSDEFVWADIPNNRMLAWKRSDATVRTFRKPSHGGNGSTIDRQGRLVTCEQYTRRMVRTEHDSSITVLVDNFEGKRFNAPNDVVVKSDGTIWFSDPDYGQSSDYEGQLELDGCHIYRYDPTDGSIRQMTHDFVMPNGLAFSTNEHDIYIIDTGSTHIAGGPNHIRRLELDEHDELHDREVFAVNSANCFDGLRLDADGRLWCGAEDGVHCYLPDGSLIGKILIPERVSNLCFGGPQLNQLLMTATTSTYICNVSVQGSVSQSI